MSNRGRHLLMVFLTATASWTFAREAEGSGSRGWSAPFMGSLSSPVVVAGTLYVGSRDGYVVAFDARSGEVRWRFRMGQGLPTGGSPIVVPADATAADQLRAAVAASEKGVAEIVETPFVDQGTVVVDAGDGLIYALDAVSGNKRWTHARGRWRSSRAADGVLYLVTVGGAEKATPLVAIDLASGKERWSYDAKLLEGVEVQSNRVYVTGRGGEYLPSEKPHLDALDPATGSRLWRTSLEGDDISRPFVGSSAIYVATADPITAEHGSATLFACDRTDGHVLWSSKAAGTLGSGNPSMLVRDDQILFATGSNLQRVDPKTGEVRWTFSAYEIHDFLTDGSAVFVDTLGGWSSRRIQALGPGGQKIWTNKLGEGYGRIHGLQDGVLFYDADHSSQGPGGTIVLHAIDAATGKKKWNQKLPNSVSAHGALADGLLFVPTSSPVHGPNAPEPGAFLAIDVRDGSSRSR